jgi:hypothetical protein
MTRAILAGTAALLFSGATAFAGGLAPPIQPITGGAVTGSNAAPSGTFGGAAPSAPIQSADASGCPVVQPAVAALQGQGFTRIDVSTGGGQATFNAMRGEVMGTYVYDCTTGALVSQNAVTASADADRSPGVFVGGVAQGSGAAGQVSGIESTAADGMSMNGTAGASVDGTASLSGGADIGGTLGVSGDASLGGDF